MRTRPVCGVLSAGVLIAVCAGISGQASKPGTGTVTGHVFCQDTQKPARFAQVALYSVPASVTALPKFDGSDQKAVQAFTKAMTEAMSSATFVMTQTAIDGSFVAQDVAPGDYYVMASVGGYIQPHELLQEAYDAGEDLTKGVAGIPLVHVSAERSASVEISVARGAAIEGRVLWDDGSGVNEATVAAEPKTGEHKQLPPQFTMLGMSSGQTMSNTDDRGHYRLSGLAPGEYTVRAMLQTSRKMIVQRGRFDQTANVGVGPLVVYAPGGFRKIDAKPVTLSAGEERTDEDITYNLAATHTVSGRVTSAEDHHGLNHGVVTLTDTTEKTFTRTAGLDADGNFSVTFVPSGTYTMTVRNAADTVPEEPKKTDEGPIFAMNQVKTVRTYQKADQQVMVADDDVTGQNIELKPDKATGASDEASGGGGR
jgi:hypothetical protein